MSETYPEGTIADGPNGPIIFSGGRWVSMQPVPPQGRVFRDPGAQADLQQGNAQAQNTAVDARVNEATQGAQITRAQADAEAAARNAQTAGLPEGWQWNADGSAAVPIAGYSRQGITPEVRQGALQAYGDADAIDSVVADLRSRFQGGPGSTSGIWSVQDYLPTATNRTFNDVGQRARGYVKRALGFTGGEGNTAAESSALYDPYLPSASDTDAQIQNKIEALEALGRQSRARAVQVLGGRPDANGNIMPIPADQVASVFGPPGPSAMDQTNFVAPAAQMQASGNTGRTSTPIPPEMQQEYQSWVLQNAANMSPDAYVQFRQGLDRKYGFESGDYTEEAQRLIDGVRNGGTLNLTIPPVDQPMTGSQAINDMVAGSAGGAVGAGFANMMSMGSVEGMAGDQYNAMRDANGGYMLGGEILGTLVPTAGIGGLGRMIAGKVAPRLLGGGTMASIGRGAATDMIYGAGYGLNTGQNPLETATEAGVGSVGGQLLGRGVGATLRGAATSAPVQALRAQGIPLTVGQTVGGIADRFEQRAMSIPLVGDMLRNRRIEGLEAFNQAAFREAGAPINFAPNAIGTEGLDQMGQAVSDAYGRATNGVTVPIDQQFGSELAQVVQGASSLPPDSRGRLADVLNARVQPLADAGQMTGDTYQQARRGLASARNSPPQQFAGFEDFYRDAISGTQDVLDNQMVRGGGQDVVTGLTAANAANRNYRTIENAANRNIGGSNTDTVQVFMPSQLQRAGLQTQQRYPGPRPFADLADNAQQVLPNTIPNSGTADRAMQIGMAGLGATALGGGAGYLAGGDAQSAAGGATVPTAALLLAALASSRGGQRALNAAITKRNPTVREFSELMLRRPGLFGAAGVPVALSSDR